MSSISNGSAQWICVQLWMHSHHGYARSQTAVHCIVQLGGGERLTAGFSHGSPTLRESWRPLDFPFAGTVGIGIIEVMTLVSIQQTEA